VIVTTSEGKLLMPKFDIKAVVANTDEQYDTLTGCGWVGNLQYIYLFRQLQALMNTVVESTTVLGHFRQADLKLAIEADAITKRPYLMQMDWENKM
jgi:hypothetical protein